MIDRRQFWQGAQRPGAQQQRRSAAEWPERLVKLVVPFPPAGAIDVVARLTAPKLQQLWGTDVVIENKPGAGGNIGNETVARAAPDGYTILLTQTGIVVNQFLYPKLTRPDRRPRAGFGCRARPNVMVVPASLRPPRRSKRSSPTPAAKTLSYGSAGNGTSEPHVPQTVQAADWRGDGARALSRLAPALNDLIPAVRRDDRQRVRARPAYPVRQPAAFGVLST